MEFGDYSDANVLRFQQYYSLSTTKMGIRDAIRDASGVLQMLPDQRQIAQHNTGDVPAIPKGSALDIYA